MNQTAVATQSDVAGSYLTFHLPRAKYALPVDSIQYITTLDAIDPHDVPGGKSGIRRMFTYEGTQIPLFNFSRLIGSTSQLEECEQLISMLKQRRQDHIDWITALEHSINHGEEFKKAADPHLCAFGLWYDKYKAHDEELRKIMAQFDAPHNRIHSLATRLLKMAHEEDKAEEANRILNDEKHSTLKVLLRLFDQATARLEEMLKPVVVILRAAGRTYGIELDSIDQIIEFDNRHWLPDEEQELQHACYDGFLQKNEGELFIRLEPAHLTK
ncbi:chemotaxis protein CheW [Thalassolituus sp.]|uniref:chemotaxis protein CheW n=1 Tax=Thalassolituus sp. TaxID=2030822 RepID=UPI00243A9165|nr:chemotaxis protein CheW [Thalassolituus sp.]MEE3209576.1 chemotaxis protein CheW [Pseudomonadota bacterium]